MYIHPRSNTGPVEDFTGFVWPHIYATMAHGVAEVIMPVGSMDSITAVKIHGTGNFGQIVVSTQGFGTAFHGGAF